MLDSTGLSWQDRIENYNRVTGFPASLFLAGDGRVVGTWILGNDYRSRTKYHGGYPPNYLRRVRALFPDKTCVLHLFSGKVDLETFPGDTADINPDLKPTWLIDAQTLAGVPIGCYDLVLADPPYTAEDADHYGTPMINRNKVLAALARLQPGAHVVWLDQMLPMWSKETFALEGAIGIYRSTNHRFRGVSIFRRL